MIVPWFLHFFAAKMKNDISGYIRCAEEESGEPMEIPVEEDGTVLLSTLSAQFPGACGLKYRSETRSLRGVRLLEGKMRAPETGWGNELYICVFPKGENRFLQAAP